MRECPPRESRVILDRVKLAPLAGSIAINAALLAVIGLLARRPTPPPSAEPIEITVVDPPPPPITQPAPAPPAASGGGSPGRSHAARTRVVPRAAEATRPWSELATRTDEAPAGDGGSGGGLGTGFGLGAGGEVIAAPLIPLPPPPAPPPPSRRHPAILLHPSRQTEVDAEELFVARVTVDREGDIVGVHMLRSHPGSRGEVADTMIWQFRYAPATDDDGKPVASTFEQSFAVR